MPGRNDPCPCGSGRKYKVCCLRAEQARSVPVADLGPRVALAWLGERFRKQIRAAIDEGFFGYRDPDEVHEACARLGNGYAEMLHINVGDYVLCEAIYERGDDEGRGIDWVLARGPRLDARQREFLEALAAAPMRLYEVVAVRPGEGLELRDVLDAERSPSFVSEQTASQTLAVGDRIGVRVLQLPDRNEIGGAVYPLAPAVAESVAARVRAAFEEPFDESLDDTDDVPTTPADDPVIDDIVKDVVEEEYTAEDEAGDLSLAQDIEDDIVVEAIREAWLDSLLDTAFPSLVDRVSGDPLALVEDDYDVRDPDALASALRACRDVQGDAGHGWARLDDPDEEIAATLTSIDAAGWPARITLFHRTRHQADRGREWFESVAGDAATFRSRRVTDPRDSMRGDSRFMPRRDAEDRTSDLSPADLGDLFEKVIRRAYAGWCDEPIPALGGRTPRACLANLRGREQVRALLRSYEEAERAQAAGQGRPAVSYGFLWEELRLARDEPGAHSA